MGLDQRDVYVTNAVKHFKFEERGKRRIHKTPSRAEVDACLPWLDNEIKLVKPRALVLLGAVAAKAVFGGGFTLTRHRGELLESELAPIVTVTIHPAAILRAPDKESRARERARFTDDLRNHAHAEQGRVRKARAECLSGIRATEKQRPAQADRKRGGSKLRGVVFHVKTLPDQVR